MRLLGLDVGRRRVGVAVSDGLGITAQPLRVIARRSRKADMAEVGGLIEEHQAGLVVVGLPRNMNGSEGAAAEEARHFARWVESDLGVGVDFQDERLTTVGAERVLLEADASRRARRKVVDKLAASIMLQTYMDRHRGDGHSRDGESQDAA